MKFKFSLSQKLIGKSLVNSNGMWEFGINKIKFNSVDLQIDLFMKIIFYL